MPVASGSLAFFVLQDRTMSQGAHRQLDMVAIGGSMGAIDPLRTILEHLPHTLRAAIFVVVHRAAAGSGMLAQAISRGAPWLAHDAIDDEVIHYGNIYVAPPDHHLVIRGGRVRVTQTPRENLARPAIDPLFRSAALSYGHRTIGILLSGLLSDGATGLQAIARCGGTTIVQTPLDCVAPEMPTSAIAMGKVDHVVPAAQIADLITNLNERPAQLIGGIAARQRNSH